MFWFLDDPESYLTMVNIGRKSNSGPTTFLDSDREGGSELGYKSE
jgi:hypothetical protein